MVLLLALVKVSAAAAGGLLLLLTRNISNISIDTASPAGAPLAPFTGVNIFSPGNCRVDGLTTYMSCNQVNGTG
jgi:hypothetical protein